MRQVCSLSVSVSVSVSFSDPNVPYPQAATRAPLDSASCRSCCGRWTAPKRSSGCWASG